MKLWTDVYQIGLVLISGLTLFAAEPAVWKEGECRRLLREAKDVPRQSKDKPKLSGHWTSTGCETRPGPEYVLRKYSFRRHKFQAQLFYYADEYCSEVTHYISAKGSVKLLRPSWRTPGAFESKYSLSQVSVIPYTDEKAKQFEKLLHRYCKESKKQSLTKYSKFKIVRFGNYRKPDSQYSIADDYDCSKIFNFTMNELQLIRMEKRHAQEYKHRNDVVRNGHIELELLLGDISTKMKQRRQYRPTHYQTPLKRDKTPNCDVCKQLANATRLRPPKLSKQVITDIGVTGDWVSQRCEARPNGQYLTRFLTFPPSGRTWKGEYEFFRDPLCKEPYFRIDVKGTFVKEGKSDVINSANDYVFRTLRIKVTPQDYQMVLYLNSYGGDSCGKPNVWKIGVSQDVTSTKGCVTLGITLPHIEHELIKTEQDNRESYMYVGQRPSDFSSMADLENRPTSFQTPLIKCGEKKIVLKSLKSNVVPSYNAMAKYSASSTNGHESMSTMMSHIMSMIFLIVFSR